MASVPNDAPAASHEAQGDLIRWLLTARDGAFSRGPLGSREQVTAILAESVPRFTFDPRGDATSRRGSAVLTLRIVGEPVTAIELTLRAVHAAAFRGPLEHLAARANWQLVDPDRREVLFPVPQSVDAGGARRLTRPALAAIVAAAAIAVAAGWTPLSGRAFWQSGSRAERATTTQRTTGLVPGLAASPANVSAAAGAGTQPLAQPMTVEEFTAQARVVGEIIRQQRTLASQFRGMRVVSEMLMVRMAEFSFQASMGNGQYIDPARLADGATVPADAGLPPQYAAPSRGGYHFTFTGIGEPGKPFFEHLSPSYYEFAYVAVPDSAESSPYTFALLSKSGKIHYREDGRTPTEGDPSVTDTVAAEAPKVLEEVRPAANETGLMSRLRTIINTFVRSKPAQDAKLAYHEDRAIQDLRVFVAAQQALLAVAARPGYGTPEVLADPSILPGQPMLAPLVDRSFTQEVREGYRFSFVGRQAIIGSGRAALYADYSYTAVPVGDGPSNRRSFAVFPDGAIRFRVDARPPDQSDRVLGTAR